METTQAIDYLLQHVTAVLGKQLDQALQEQLGIGLAQYRVLATLEMSPELEQHAIAKHLAQTEAGVSRQIKLLTEKGLLKSKVNIQSRREHLAALTPKGVKLIQAGRQVIDRYNKPILDVLPDKQQKQLVELLVTLHSQTCRPGKLTACDHPYLI